MEVLHINPSIIWLRAETRIGEKRTFIIPKHAQSLIKSGIAVFVEKSCNRIYKDDEYQQVGCNIVEPGSWVDAPLNALIVGFKELPKGDFPLRHRHLYGAHFLDGEQEAFHFMPRFKAGGGTLYAAEAILSSTAAQIVPPSAGYLAGVAGAVLGLFVWHQKQINVPRPFAVPKLFNQKSDAYEYVCKLPLNELRQQVRCLVIAPNGNVGKGVRSVLEVAQIGYDAWTRTQTSNAEYLASIYNYDIVFNCLSLDNITEEHKLHTPVFLTVDSIEAHPDSRLSVVSDISCYPTHPCNTMPIYNHVTTWDNPTIQVSGVDIIAIDNLPTMLAKECSDMCSMDLFPLICQLLLIGDNVENTPWTYVVQRFKEGRDRI